MLLSLIHWGHRSYHCLFVHRSLCIPNSKPQSHWQKKANPRYNPVYWTWGYFFEKVSCRIKLKVRLKIEWSFSWLKMYVSKSNKTDRSFFTDFRKTISYISFNAIPFHLQSFFLPLHQSHFLIFIYRCYLPQPLQAMPNKQYLCIRSWSKWSSFQWRTTMQHIRSIRRHQ